MVRAKRPAGTDAAAGTIDEYVRPGKAGVRARQLGKVVPEVKDVELEVGVVASDVKAVEPDTNVLEQDVDVAKSKVGYVDAEAEAEAMDPSAVEDTLRLFDLNPRYGPFVGMERLMRWRRAEKFGLQPPELVRILLESGRGVPQREGGYLW